MAAVLVLKYSLLDFLPFHMGHISTFHVRTASLHTSRPCALCSGLTFLSNPGQKPPCRVDPGPMCRVSLLEGKTSLLSMYSSDMTHSVEQNDGAHIYLLDRYALSIPPSGDERLGDRTHGKIFPHECLYQEVIKPITQGETAPATAELPMYAIWRQ